MPHSRLRRFIFSSLLLLPLTAGAASAPLDATIYTKKGELSLRLETAFNDVDREHGLMARGSLKPDDGMLFIFPGAGDYKFWMKNTKIPLDMIFVDTENTVVYIAAHTKPNTLSTHSAGRPVIAVIELDGGRCAREGVAVGDRVRYVLPEGTRVE